MYRIVVVPEQLRALSARLQQAATELDALGGHIGGAYGGLDWETRYKAGVEGQVGDARRRAAALAQQAEAMARFLTTKAQAFEEADRQGVAALNSAGALFMSIQEQWSNSPYAGYIRSNDIYPHLRLGQLMQGGSCSPAVTPVLMPTPSPANTPIAIDILWNGTFDVLKRADWLSLIPLSALMIMEQTDVLGRMHVFGREWLKTIAGVSEKLTIIRPENLSWHMLRDAVKLSTSPLANLLTVTGLVPTLIEDWQTYSGQGSAKLGAAILVDSALEITLNKSFQIGGAILGGLLTPVLGPWGPVLGYGIGGVVGSYITDWVRSTPVHTEVVEITARGLETIGRTVTQSTQAVADMTARSLEAAGKVVSDAPRKITQTVTNVLDSVTRITLPNFRLSL